MARMSWLEACQLDSSLLSLDHLFTSPPLYAQTLTGGLTNRCWKVVCPDLKAYVWRPTTPITQAFSISRHQEYQLLCALAPSAISPKAIHLNDRGLLVEWLEGQLMDRTLSLGQLLDTLAVVHATDIHRLPVAPFNYTARINHYWIQLQDTLKTPSVTELYKQWGAAPELELVPDTLCHFDLAGYNMVNTETGLKVIDWEYAGLADPRLDLTLSLEASGSPLEEAVYQYCQLRQIEQVDLWMSGVLAWRPRTQLLALLWYLLAYQLWGEAVYLRQAEELEQRFCKQDHCLDGVNDKMAASNLLTPCVRDRFSSRD
ncbi:phosphotransferase [Vibrio sp.]|uniref:phosphotransferase n=1 Tax=Vibrio sp. TaxID=678 RepID=UPI003D0EF738